MFFIVLFICALCSAIDYSLPTSSTLFLFLKESSNTIFRSMPLCAVLYRWLMVQCSFLDPCYILCRVLTKLCNVVYVGLGRLALLPN